jgi:hypothetical protein
MTDRDSDTHAAGWTLIQLAELVRGVEDLLVEATTVLAPDAHGGMPADAELSLGSTERQRVSDTLEEVAETADRLLLLASQLPQGEVHASYEDVRDAAAEDLTNGILDPQRALLAARLLDVRSGWPALAVALRESDVVTAWGSITVEQLLGRFRGGDRELVQRVVAEAGLPPDSPFASCQDAWLEQLAGALERHASRSRGT